MLEKVSRRLKVLNTGNFKTKQQVYEEFRDYGRLLQVKKDGDFFIVDFLKVADAVDAKLCLDCKGDIGYEGFKYDFKGFKWVYRLQY